MCTRVRTESFSKSSRCMYFIALLPADLCPLTIYDMMHHISTIYPVGRQVTAHSPSSKIITRSTLKYHIGLVALILQPEPAENATSPYTSMEECVTQWLCDANDALTRTVICNVTNSSLLTDRVMVHRLSRKFLFHITFLGVQSGPPALIMFYIKNAVWTFLNDSRIEHSFRSSTHHHGWQMVQ